MDSWTPVRSLLYSLIPPPVILRKFSKLGADFGYITPLIFKKPPSISSCTPGKTEITVATIRINTVTPLL